MRHSHTYRSRPFVAVRLFSALLVTAMVAGCGGPQKGEGSGGECFRDADCKEGLVCVDGECSSDVDSLVSVVEGPGTTTAAVGAGGATATATATSTTTGGMTGAGGNGAVGAGGAMGASTTDGGTTDGGTTDGGTTDGGTTDGGTTDSAVTGAGGASVATATATETTGISGNAGAPTDP